MKKVFFSFVTNESQGIVSSKCTIFVSGKAKSRILFGVCKLYVCVCNGLKNVFVHMQFVVFSPLRCTAIKVCLIQIWENWMSFFVVFLPPAVWPGVTDGVLFFCILIH